ncbi:zinc finger protein 59-like [Anopheles bellator]|uniref:zinc finger protein 59-like n=1 Tax=Anopheles bellator TaxID=139047 RepID=UPI0026471A3A|nr:zinc finger protein 59-like [Anopheles bellator]
MQNWNCFVECIHFWQAEEIGPCHRSPLTSDPFRRAVLANFAQYCDKYYLLISKIVSILDSFVPKEIAGAGGCNLAVTHDAESRSVHIIYGDVIEFEVESVPECDEDEHCDEVAQMDDVMEEMLVETIAEDSPPLGCSDEVLIQIKAEEVLSTARNADVEIKPLGEAADPKYQCQFVNCPKTFRLAKEYAAHQDSTHPWQIDGEVKVRCKFLSCDARFSSIPQLQAHHVGHRLRKREPKKRSSRKGPEISIRGRCCEHCHVVLKPHVNVYSQHCLEEHDCTPYTCPLCNEPFHLQSHLGDHLKSVHSSEELDHLLTHNLWREFTIVEQRLAECRFCYRVFTVHSLSAHVHHHRRELQQCCPRCGGAHFASFCNLPKPQRAKSWEKLRCSECGCWFSKKNFKEHMATHTHERNFPCTVCKKTFKVRRTATRHIQSHVNAANRKRLCYDCDTVLENEVQIVDHYQAEHPTLQPYRCPICCEGFFKKSLLVDHCHAHTDGERRAVSVKEPMAAYTIGKAQVFECTLCRRSFSTKRCTIAHLIVHTDRPHVCRVCNISFRLQTNLDDHMKDMHLRKCETATSE